MVHTITHTDLEGPWQGAEEVEVPLGKAQAEGLLVRGAVLRGRGGVCVWGVAHGREENSQKVIRLLSRGVDVCGRGGLATCEQA